MRDPRDILGDQKRDTRRAFGWPSGRKWKKMYKALRRRYKGTLRTSK